VTSAAPLQSRFTTLVCLLTFLWFAGCNKPAPESPSAATNAKSVAASGQTGSPNEKRGAAQKLAAEKDRERLAAAEAVPVEVAAVVRGPISAFLSYNSALEAEAIVDIYPQTAGQVDTLLVEEGSVVKAGDPLLKIDERELRVDVEETSINYQHQLQGFARIEDLHRRNLINPQEFEKQPVPARPSPPARRTSQAPPVLRHGPRPF